MIHIESTFFLVFPWIFVLFKLKVFVALSCPTLPDCMECSLPGFSARGILQARTLSGLPFPFPGYLPSLEIKPEFPAFQVSPPFQADSLLSEGDAQSWFGWHILFLCFNVVVLVSYDFYNKWSQTQWLKTTDTFILFKLRTVEVRSMKSVSLVQNQGFSRPPSRDFRGKSLSFPFPASRVVFLGPWPLPPHAKPTV